MFAFIRASFPTSPQLGAWSDALVDAWMDPAIPFSGAHFWKTTTFGQADMSFVRFPSVTLDDPRTAEMGTDEQANELVAAVFRALDDDSKPDWSTIDRCIIFFPEATALFGGGSHATPGGTSIPAAVINGASPFDAHCQEVGHALGLEHERDHGGDAEYGCPYSVMSASGTDLSFDRGIDPRLPGAQGSTNPLRTAGPYVPMAHLYTNAGGPVDPHGVVCRDETVVQVPASCLTTPERIRLVARDVAIAAWPAREPVLAVIPPLGSDRFTYFLELRRPDASYDRGPPWPAICILAADFGQLSPIADPPFRYVGHIQLGGPDGDLDHHLYSSGLVIRVGDRAADASEVELTIAGGEAWRDFRLRLACTAIDHETTASSDFRFASVQPCHRWPAKAYAYRTDARTTGQELLAESDGYEQPGFEWQVNGTTLDPQRSSAVVEAACRGFDDGIVSQPRVESVTCSYRIDGARLRLEVADPWYEVDLTVRVAVFETSPEVVKNAYPHRSAQVTATCRNIVVTWDEEFRRDRAACLGEDFAIETTRTVVVGETPPWRDDRPKWEILAEHDGDAAAVDGAIDETGGAAGGG